MSFLAIVCAGQISLYAQNVGIGTTNPQARLHVADSNVLFTGPAIVDLTAKAPQEGPGIRMSWYAGKAAFRVGRVNGTQWDQLNTGEYSFAAGQNTRASGRSSTALGSETIASKDYAFAAGYNTSANGERSIALGGLTTANGPSSFAAGHNSHANGASSIAVGNYAQAMGDYQTVLGFSTIAEGEGSVAVGYDATAHGHESVAIGRFVTTNSFRQTALGVYSHAFPASSQTQWLGTDPLFIIGNGTSILERSNALTILKNGKAGFGTVAPKALVHIDGNFLVGGENITPGATAHVEGSMLLKKNSYSGAGQLLLEETAAADGARITFRNTNVSGKFWDVFGLTNASDPATASFNIYYQGSGNAFVIYGTGNASLKGVLTQQSDVRFKKNIQPIRDALKKLSAINGYHYHWKDSAQDSRLQTGVLAQEIEQWMPELVITNEKGEKSVNYSGLIPYLLEGLKTQQQQIEALKQEIKQLHQ
jgi:autotransporter adhesin